jgi:hypothetical protein
MRMCGGHKWCTGSDYEIGAGLSCSSYDGWAASQSWEEGVGDGGWELGVSGEGLGLGGSAAAESLALSTMRSLMRRAREVVANQSLVWSSRPQRTEDGSCQGGGSVESAKGGISMPANLGVAATPCRSSSGCVHIFPVPEGRRPVVASLFRGSPESRCNNANAISRTASSMTIVPGPTRSAERPEKKPQSIRRPRSIAVLAANI